MTREEAKRRIEICRDFLANNYSDMGEPNFTAFNMAIKALSSWEKYSDKLWKKAYERGKTEVMEVIKAHMEGEDKNTKAVLSDIMESVNELEPLEQEPCDDAISREAVLKTINNNTADERDGWLCIDNDFVHEIEQLPSVTQKSDEQLYKNGFADGYEQGHKDAGQKSGKWIYEEVTRYEEYYDTVRSYVDKKCKCSACGHDYGYQRMKDPFCRYCGAKMVEPQESEDKE